MNQYGSKFDSIFERWMVIEGEHDRLHPERSQCGGVGGCSMMFVASQLENEMLEELTEQRRSGRIT